MSQIKAVIFDWGRTLYNSEKKEEYVEADQLLKFCRSRGYKLGLASLVTHHAVANLDERINQIERSPLRKYFDIVRVTDVDKDKIFDEIVAELGYKRVEVLIVDDRTIRGIRYGNLHGHPTVWVKNGKFESELPNADTGMPTYTALSLGDVKAFIESF
jgi:FMN phosphatase YigB (HAD superfamily)